MCVYQEKAVHLGTGEWTLEFNELYSLFMYKHRIFLVTWRLWLEGIEGTINDDTHP